MNRDDLRLHCPKGHWRAFELTSDGSYRRVEQNNLGDVTFRDWVPDDQGNRTEGLCCVRCGAEVSIDDAAETWGDEFLSQDLEVESSGFTNRVATADETAEVLSRIMGDHEMVRVETAASSAVFGGSVAGLLTAVRESLPPRLFKHQSDAIDKILQGHDVAISTGTASGKTEAFLAPALQVLLQDSKAIVLVMYPTKALLADQISRLRGLGDHLEDLGADHFRLTFSGAGNFEVARLDGNVKDSRETRLRGARLLLSTPDQMHSIGIKTFLESNRLPDLRLVVIDEAHQYTGELGSRVGAMMRRLDLSFRIIKAQLPRLIVSSASLGDARQWAESLTGRVGFEVIDRDFSFRSGRILIVGSPENPDPNDHPRVAVATRIIGELLSQLGDRLASTVVFFPAKWEIEGVMRRVSKMFKNTGNSEFINKIAVYTADVAKENREKIEERLRRGERLVVLATNALEVGVDFPGVELVVATDPSITQPRLLQQLGRGGRRSTGLAVVLNLPTHHESWVRTNKEIADLLSGDLQIVPAQHPTMGSLNNFFAEGLARSFEMIPSESVIELDPSCLDALDNSGYWMRLSEGSWRRVTSPYGRPPELRNDLSQFWLKDVDGGGSEILSQLDHLKHAYIGARLMRGRLFEVVKVAQNTLFVVPVESTLTAGADLLFGLEGRVAGEFALQEGFLVERAEGTVVIQQRNCWRVIDEERFSFPPPGRPRSLRIESAGVVSVKPVVHLDPNEAEIVAQMVMATLVNVGIEPIGIDYQISQTDGRIDFFECKGESSLFIWSLADLFPRILEEVERKLAAGNSLRLRSHHKATTRMEVPVDQLRDLMARISASEHRKAA